MATLRASFLESTGVVVERAETPVVVYMDHQVSQSWLPGEGSGSSGFGEQMEGRRLLKNHHDNLIRALSELTDIAEVHVADIRKISTGEKLKLFGRATVCLLSPIAIARFHF